MSDNALPVILVVCPTMRDRREIHKLGLDSQFQFLFHDYATIELEQIAGRSGQAPLNVATIEAELEWIAKRYSKEEISGVMSTDDYPGATLASVIALAWKLPGTSPYATLMFQHKFFSRCMQAWVVPDAVPGYELCGDPDSLPALDFPIVVKPVKSFFSIGAVRVNDSAEYKRSFAKAQLPAAFFMPMREIFERITRLQFGSSVVLAEQFVAGEQVTLEGYVENGVCNVLGIVDSIMYPGTQSFQRFEYPSSAPSHLQQRMAVIAAELIRESHYENGFFNVEFIYDVETSKVKIVEVNPRMASQFADLFEKVDGRNSYSILVNLCIGVTVQPQPRVGSYAVAASCVLRCSADRFVKRVPSSEEVERVEHYFPGTRVEILALANTFLSDEMQDGASFRYAVINIGADSRHQLLERLDQCLVMLPFNFDIPDRTDRTDIAPGSPIQEEGA